MLATREIEMKFSKIGQALLLIGGAGIITTGFFVTGALVLEKEYIVGGLMGSFCCLISAPFWELVRNY